MKWEYNLQPWSKPLIFRSIGRAVVSNGSRRAVSRKVFGDEFSGGVIAHGDLRIARESVDSDGSEVVDWSEWLDSPLAERSSRLDLNFDFTAVPRWRDTVAACERAVRLELLEKTAVSVLIKTTSLRTL
jgi:hypothetical protein